MRHVVHHFRRMHKWKRRKKGIVDKWIMDQKQPFEFILLQIKVLPVKK